ncbi:MAG: hypothetical protein OSB34_12615 [Planktomarina sp.]|nr:hypothetical protein [Planktomarina sp.]
MYKFSMHENNTLNMQIFSVSVRVLLLSSGAVYGDISAKLAGVPKDFQGVPNQLRVRSAYSERRRVSELPCMITAVQNPKIALIFADLGYSVVEPFAEEFPDHFINAGVA